MVSPAAPALVAPVAPTLVAPAVPTLVSPAAPLLQLNAPIAADNTPPGTAPTSGHSISGTPAAGGASTLAELDAITGAAADVPCTLLHFVNGELIDVAKATIVQPSRRADEVLALNQCFNWSMVWPKSQIRLGARDTTPQTAPPAVPAPSHGKTTPTVPPSADEDMHMAQDPNDGPDEDSTFANLDCHFDFGADYDLSSQPSQAAAEGKTYCNKRRLFCSQETPPAADFTETEPIAEVRSVISPNTLKKACEEENAVPINTKPKGRKRKNKNDKSASQPAPIRARDGPPVPKNIESRVHVSGQRMLIQRLYDAAPGPMRSLVDGIQFMEERRIREKDHGYPVYVAKVPSGHGFVDSGYAEKIFLRYDDIFAMLNSYPLHYTFIRLYSLSKAMRIIRNNIPDIAIADPFYMRAVHLATAGDQAVASGYLKDFFLANQKKCNLLLPVFPEDKTCTLISITLKHSVATYLDADGESKTDYTNVKAVLDDALNGYAKAKGHMRGQMLDMTWYVVYKGKVPGVYNDWEECRRQVHRFSGNSYKGLASVAGIDKLEALLLRLRFPSSRSAEHFAGAFCGGAGGSGPFPLGRAQSIMSFRLRCGLRIRVARSRDPDEGSEFAFLEGLELRHRADT
ncbi:hypothetical protein QYE76_005419 [Lolium multiflorum]|uniref:Ribonuclease H1 N-terminal domain-containing protein n=1 Tax=Lolium multiflorum TaxID=4521 RepID=A0AAD8RTZ3_LOLMU|nr:hypothetical protein QYE76_005419 [Lolium multiflorum]